MFDKTIGNNIFTGRIHRNPTIHPSPATEKSNLSIYLSRVSCQIPARL